MSRTELEKLRRTRSQIHFQLGKLEPLVAGYHAKLTEVEARMLELDPQFWLTPRRYKANPYFARNELPRLAITILREAGEPLPIRVIAARALATKGVTLPDRKTWRSVRVQLQKMFWRLDRRGLTVLVGEGIGAKRAIMPPAANTRTNQR